MPSVPTTCSACVGARPGLALEVLEVVILRGGGQVVLPGSEGLLLLCQEFGDSLVVLIEPVLVDPFLRIKQGLDCLLD